MYEADSEQIIHITKEMKHQKIKCHGHQCPDRYKCKLYTPARTPGDDDEGDNSVECDVKEYYAIKVR